MTIYTLHILQSCFIVQRNKQQTPVHNHNHFVSVLLFTYYSVCMCISHSSLGVLNYSSVCSTNIEHAKGLCYCEQHFQGIEPKPYFVYFTNQGQCECLSTGILFMTIVSIYNKNLPPKPAPWKNSNQQKCIIFHNVVMEILYLPMF